MSPRDDTAPAEPPDPGARLRHEVLTPVTVISLRTGLLRRRVAVASCLAPDDRARLLVDVAAIEDAARALCAAAGGIDRAAGRR